ncbi:hypothetical protein T484DRAFT_1911261, partial [Baffinella frigidus]
MARARTNNHGLSLLIVLACGLAALKLTGADSDPCLTDIDGNCLAPFCEEGLYGGWSCDAECDGAVHCSNHGRCTGDGSCECRTGWIGERCSVVPGNEPVTTTPTPPPVASPSAPPPATAEPPMPPSTQPEPTMAPTSHPGTPATTPAPVETAPPPTHPPPPPTTPPPPAPPTTPAPILPRAPPFCEEGLYGGEYCDEECDVVTDCSNHGRCTGDGACECHSEWTGHRCAVPISSEPVAACNPGYADVSAPGGKLECELRALNFEVASEIRQDLHSTSVGEGVASVADESSDMVSVYIGAISPAGAGVLAHVLRFSVTLSSSTLSRWNHTLHLDAAACSATPGGGGAGGASTSGSQQEAGSATTSSACGVHFPAALIGSLPTGARLTAVVTAHNRVGASGGTRASPAEGVVLLRAPAPPGNVTVSQRRSAGVLRTTLAVAWERPVHYGDGLASHLSRLVLSGFEITVACGGGHGGGEGATVSMHAAARAMDLSAVWGAGGEGFVLEGDGKLLGLACVRGGEVTVSVRAASAFFRSPIVLHVTVSVRAASNFFRSPPSASASLSAMGFPGAVRDLAASEVVSPDARRALNVSFMLPFDTGLGDASAPLVGLQALNVSFEVPFDTGLGDASAPLAGLQVEAATCSSFARSAACELHQVSSSVASAGYQSVLVTSLVTGNVYFVRARV